MTQSDIFLKISNKKQQIMLSDVFVEMKKAKHVPLTQDQTRMMINVLMASDEVIENIYNDFNKIFPMNAFFKRCEVCLPIKYEKRLLVWIVSMFGPTQIGGLILIGYYLQWYAFNAGVKELTLSRVCESVFPFGIFPEEVIEEFWRKQKGQVGNLVDYAPAQKSFIP